MAAQPHARLILFAAPAGFGKTAALRDLAERRCQSGEAVAWLPLSAEDDLPLRFCQRLIETLADVLPGLGKGSLCALRNALPVTVEDVVESLLADFARQARRVLLVVDDLHLITHPELLAALGRLVKLGPANFVLAVGSCSQPPLNLATLRAKDWLLEIGLDELRLEREEIREYFALGGLPLDERTLTLLHAQTEGWFTGVHLARLWLLQHPQESAQLAQQLGDQAAVGDYLLRTVFERLPGQLQDAVLALAVASQFNAELASALTGREDGQALLEHLERIQLFLLPLDRDRHWYRFHPLFADFLRARLKAQDPERFTQLHFNASLWFTNHHMQDLAIEHACLAEDPEMLAALVDGSGLDLINRGQLTRIHRWRQRVPDEIAKRFPVLVLADVWTKAAEMSLPEANRLLDELLVRWGQGPARDALGEGRLAALTVKAMIALQKDDLELCVTLAGKAEAQLGRHAPFLETALLLIGALAEVVMVHPERARHLLALAHQRNHLLEGRYLGMQLGNVEMLMVLEQGHVKQAHMLFMRLREGLIGSFGEKSRARALPTIAESLLAYHQCRLDGLEEQLRWALEHVDLINPIDLYAQGMLALARTQRLRGNAQEALATLHAMQALSARNHAWRFYVEALGEEMAMILQEPSADRIKRVELRLKDVDWERLTGLYERRGFNPVRWTRGLLNVRLQQARGHHSEALHGISQLRGTLRVDWHGLQHLRLDLLAALSYHRLDYQERAHGLMGSCLVDGEREGVRSLFVEEGPAIHELLEQVDALERQPALQGFIRELLALWPGQGTVSATDSHESLTEREREVIGLAASGLSNEAISQHLAVALGTVKWHLHNTYEKLKVRNRTQAIRRARELGLFA
ncbi:LuxR C-terminal-related transcriptional regulator [Pseudomonas sp. RIT-PI-AD]|uniref:LuxR C-terminal-related transcriptional regulator n=1 Tax=Pseudomonas sp. RIT-PI-AD TaxID=3035294 RepID=UPI0021D9316D|nr:LuxR C-terminal-related transcriptional regulator [Pseudomonas sp. RIT-PI-AD]